MDEVTKVTDQEFQDEVTSNDKVVAKFYADWCGTCRLFASKYKKIAKDESFSDVKFLDVNAEENPQARQMVGVTNLPFFATFKNGELVEADYTAKEDAVKQMIERIQN
jgi:thioredoxin-like negative regulator of GroEL